MCEGVCVVKVKQRLCLMGPPAVSAAGREVPLKLRPKEWALLARICLVNRPMSRKELAELIFPDADHPRGSLRWHLSALRKKLPKPLGESLRLESELVWTEIPTDVEGFRAGACVVRDRPGGPDDQGVLALYRGDLCAGLTVSASPHFDNWVYVEQESLRRLFRQAVLSYARWAAEAGRQRSAIPSLRKLVTVDPYFEDGHILLIEAHEALGEREAATAAYHLYQRIVREELQAEPRPSLSRRYEGRSLPGPVLPREELVPLREVTIHIVDWEGEDPPILGIHGSAGSAYSLTALGERLAPGNRFIAMDLRGHGFSDKPPSGYELTHHVNDVLQLLSALGLGRPVVLGFSLGGPVAAAVATQADLRGLILLDGAVAGRETLEKRGPETLVPTSETLALKFKSVDEYLQRWRAEHPRYSDDAERWLDRFGRFELAPLPDGTFRRRGLRTALHAEWLSVLDGDSLGTLARVRCPVLIVKAADAWIGGRPFLSDDVLDAQLRACPHAKRFVAHSSNHGSLIRDPEPELLDAIRAFVREPSASVTAQPG